MLVALGFLVASLLALLIAPAFWARAVRLTTRRLKESLPLTEAEIKADKDRLRAEYAIRVHKLEMSLEQAKLQRARDTIEINRRDGAISRLEQDISGLRLELDEHQNARRVLEQTVADRLPKVEHRLSEAKTLLFNRDREIAELTNSSRRQQNALDEATSINAQQTAEIDRLSNALTVRGARNSQVLADPRFEGELALRAEIEALRGKTREQAAVIARLQGPSGRGTPLLAAPATDAAPEPKADEKAAPQLVVVGDADVATERELRAAKSRIEDQAAELARLGAELAALKTGPGEAADKDSKIALRARLNAVQAEAEQQGETIKRLRAELAAANERIALQGAHFMEQMRRLGAGTLPASGQTRAPVTQGSRPSLAERIAQQRPAAPASRPKIVAETSPAADPSPAAEAKTVEDAATSAAAADAERAEPAAAKQLRLIDRIQNINKA
jgi:chromosome segregation ATPase